MSSKDKIKFEIKAKDKYSKNNPVVVNFSIQNQSDEDIWVLSWHTPLEGIKGNILRIKCNEQELLYEGPMVKRGMPSKNDYIHVEPRGSVSRDVDLSKAYTLPSDEECSVEFDGKIYDLAASGDILPKQAEEHQTIHIPGNNIKFRISN
jgi:peptidyl-Lys metalloendopeptidase